MSQSRASRERARQRQASRQARRQGAADHIPSSKVYVNSNDVADRIHRGVPPFPCLLCGSGNREFVTDAEDACRILEETAKARGLNEVPSVIPASEDGTYGGALLLDDEEVLPVRCLDCGDEALSSVKKSIRAVQQIAEAVKKARSA